MQMSVIRRCRPISGYDNDIETGFDSGFFQTVCFAYAAANPIAHHRTSEFNAYRDSETIDT